MGGGGSRARHGRDEWRDVLRPVPSHAEEFMRMPPANVVEAVGFLAKLDLATATVAPPFDAARQYKAEEAFEALRGLTAEELGVETEVLVKARELCFECGETLRQQDETMLREHLYYDHKRFLLMGGDLRPAVERAYFELFATIDVRRRGHLRAHELRTWVRKTSEAVSDSLFLDYVFRLIPTVRHGYVRVEEMIQCIERFAVMSDSELVEFAFAVLSSLRQEHHEGGVPRIELDELQRFSQYFSQAVVVDGDEAGPPPRKGPAGDLSLNDKLLIELRRYAERGTMNHEGFAAMCRRSPLATFPLKWMQTTFFANPLIGKDLQSRMAVVSRHRTNSGRMATLRGLCVTPDDEQSLAAMRLYADRTQGPHGANSSRIVSHGADGSRVGSRGANSSRTGFRGNSSARLRPRDLAPTQSELRSSRASILKQSREVRAMRYQLEADKVKKRPTSRIKRDSFFTATDDDFFGDSTARRSILAAPRRSIARLRKSIVRVHVPPES